MSDVRNALTPAELIARLGGAGQPLVFDVRRRQTVDAVGRMVAGARWRPHDKAAEWGRSLPAAADVVVYCVHGHEVSQAAAALLRSLGLKAGYLLGGFEAYTAAGGPSIGIGARPDCDITPSHWITRERPKVDRIAVPWLVRRFVDPDAVIHYVAPDRVAAVAEEIGAIPFDIDGVEYSHEGERCSFDTCIARLGIADDALMHLARIVRGADTARLDLEPECAGLLAAALGISSAAADDRQALAAGMVIYDALYAWVRFARAERHNWPADWQAARPRA